MATNQELIDYYANLLIIQYNQKPKAKAHISAYAEALLASNVFFDVLNGYDIETAVGKQLDVLGKYIGLDRYYEGDSYDVYFAFTYYDESPIDSSKVGLTDYTDYDDEEGKILSYPDVITKKTALLDDDYRLLLKLKIILNNSNFGHKEIDDSLWKFFGGDLVADSTGDMMMDFFVTGDRSVVINAAISKGLLPMPMAVGGRYLISSDVEHLGFSDYSGTSGAGVGLASYDDYDTISGEVANYSKLTDIFYGIL